MQTLLNSLRAAGEPTRLRLLALLARAQLTVSELTQILGQSQPRVSRHLKLLCEAQLIDRFQEGSWVFYRFADHGPAVAVARALANLIPEHDAELERDTQRLAAIKRAHAARAAAYFDENAAHWDHIRSLYVAESEVERAMVEALGDDPIDDLLDLGTGTGHVLRVFSDRIRRGLGIDCSREMLAVARANLEQSNLRHCQVRQGDIYNLELPSGAVDAAIIHHVLHFLDDPAAAVAEAARTLRPGGRLLIVDFSPHQLEFLRTRYAHRRLGFTDDEVASWCEAAGLGERSVRHLAAAGKTDSEQLVVSLWCSTRRKDSAATYEREVA